jgi:YidC/Oxa1 family membrane protein insertase
MLIMMPLMSLWIGFAMPAGLCIYWISNSILMMVQEVICGKMLKKDYEAAQKEMAEQAKKAKEADKERRRLAAEKKAAALAASKSGKVKKVQPQAKNKGVDLSASREGMRSYARGRAYDPDRYPVTPYRDPNAKYGKKDDEELEPLTEEEKALLAERGITIPEETPTLPAETGPDAIPEESVISTEEAAPVEASADEAEEGDYEAPYEDQETKE